MTLTRKNRDFLLMEEILHQLIWQIFHYLQGCTHVGWLFGISEPSTVCLPKGTVRVRQVSITTTTFNGIFQHTSGTYSRPPINSLCRKFLNNFVCVCVPLEMPAVCSTWRIMPVSKYFQSQIYNPIKGP